MKPLWKRRVLRLPILFSGLVALYTLVTILFFWEWVPHLHSALIGPPEDNMQDFWNTHYVAVERHDGNLLFTNLIRFPEGTPLYYHSFAYPKVFAIALLSMLFGTDVSTLVLLQNLSLLLSFPLAAVGAFYLVRYLTGSAVGALVGGFIFAFNPSHTEHLMHHIGVSSIEFIPFFVLAYLLALEKRSALWLVCAVAFYALSALSHWYYLFYIAYFITFHTAYHAIRNRAMPTGWNMFTPLACLAGVIAVLSPLLVPMLQAALKNVSVYAEGSHQVADLIAYVAFPQFHYLSFLSDGIYWRLTGNVWESTVYLGLVNLAMIAWLCLRAENRDGRLLVYAFSGMAVFCILASGQWLHVLGHRTIPMPDMLLSNLPFFRNVRGPSRAIVFAYLFLAIIVAHAYALAWRQRNRSLVRWGIPAVAALIVFDFYPAHRLFMTPVSCAPGLAVIRDDPNGGFGVLNLPSGRPVAYVEGNAYMLQQTCHRRPIAQGNTSRDVVTTLRDRLETQDFAAQRRQLTEARIKYVVINHPNGRYYRWRAEDGPLEQYSMTYSVVYDGPDITVLRVY